MNKDTSRVLCEYSVSQSLYCFEQEPTAIAVYMPRNSRALLVHQVRELINIGVQSVRSSQKEIYESKGDMKESNNHSYL